MSRLSSFYFLLLVLSMSGVQVIAQDGRDQQQPSAPASARFSTAPGMSVWHTAAATPGMFNAHRPMSTLTSAAVDKIKERGVQVPTAAPADPFSSAREGHVGDGGPPFSFDPGKPSQEQEQLLAGAAHQPVHAGSGGGADDAVDDNGDEFLDASSVYGEEEVDASNVQPEAEFVEEFSDAIDDEVAALAESVLPATVDGSGHSGTEPSGQSDSSTPVQTKARDIVEDGLHTPNQMNSGPVQSHVAPNSGEQGKSDATLNAIPVASNDSSRVEGDSESPQRSQAADKDDQQAPPVSSGSHDQQHGQASTSQAPQREQDGPYGYVNNSSLLLSEGVQEDEENGGDPDQSPSGSSRKPKNASLLGRAALEHECRVREVNVKKEGMSLVRRFLIGLATFAVCYGVHELYARYAIEDAEVPMTSPIMQ